MPPVPPAETAALGDAITRSVEFAREPHTPESDEPEAPLADGAADVDPPLVVLLLSDGKNTQGETEPSEAAAEAMALGVPVHTVALGT